MKAMIFAAGLGTRLKPLTNSIPKALVEFNGKTLLQYNIENLIRFGVTDIIINVHHFSQMVINFVAAKNNFGINIQISDERDGLLNTGGGLKKASWFFDDDDPFILFNVDIICNTDLTYIYNSHKESKAIATLLVTERKSSRYLLFSSSNNLCGWENVKTGEKIISRQLSKFQKFAFGGIHIVDPKIFKYFPEEEEFSIIDFYLKVSEKENISCFNHSEDIWFDVGTIEKLNEAERLFL